MQWVYSYIANHRKIRASQQAVLKRLTQVEAFERFLHQTYPGQKRFSLYKI